MVYDGIDQAHPAFPQEAAHDGGDEFPRLFHLFAGSSGQKDPQLFPEHAHNVVLVSILQVGPQTDAVYFVDGFQNVADEGARRVSSAFGAGLSKPSRPGVDVPVSPKFLGKFSGGEALDGSEGAEHVAGGLFGIGRVGIGWGGVFVQVLVDILVHLRETLRRERPSVESAGEDHVSPGGSQLGMLGREGPHESLRLLHHVQELTVGVLRRQTQLHDQAVHLVDHQHDLEARPDGRPDGRLSRPHQSVRGVHHHHRSVRGGQAGHHLVQKVGMAGTVHGRQEMGLARGRGRRQRAHGTALERHLPAAFGFQRVGEATVPRGNGRQEVQQRRFSRLEVSHRREAPLEGGGRGQVLDVPGGGPFRSFRGLGSGGSFFFLSRPRFSRNVSAWMFFSRTGSTRGLSTSVASSSRVARATSGPYTSAASG
mmetsp:Transcript_42745/g.100363  ORF Transcript_42745/g.100363 Transcript_42745/m.100363 type:complete len:424 (+) Transcript_42745:1740-3011(+)